MMQNQPYIDIERLREFSEIISDSLTLLRQTFKVQIRLIATYLGPLVLLSAIVTTYTTLNSLDTMSFVFSNPSSDMFETLESESASMTLLTYGGSVFHWFVIWLIVSVSLCVVRQYRDGAGVVDPALVGKHIRRTILPISVSFLLVSFIVAFSLLGVVIGALIAAIFLVLQPASIVLEDQSAFQAVSRSIHLVRNAWWFTFGVVIVILILESVFQYVFSFIPTIMIIGKAVAGDSNTNSVVDIVTGILIALSTIAGMFLSIVLGTSLGVLWGHHRERVDSNAIEDKIRQIGARE